jgi:hypothetical protein
MSSSYSEQDYEGLASQILGGDARMMPSRRGRYFLHFAAALLDFHDFLKTEEDEKGRKVLVTMRDLLSQAQALSPPDRQTLKYLRIAVREISCIRSAGPLESSLWASHELNAHTMSVPGMLHKDSMKYYKWIGSTMSGVGEVVELGCWMGSSTCALAEGLSLNEKFQNRRIHAFDSFIWEKWMNFYAKEFTLRRTVALRDSYLDLFLRFCAPYRKLVEPHQCYVSPVAISTSPSLSWHGDEIELFVYDMGSIYKQISYIWGTFSPYFVSGKTYVIFNEYGKLRSEDIWRFCREHGKQLLPVHKPAGSAKGFIFRE